MRLLKPTKQISNIFLLILLVTIVAPQTHSHSYWGHDRDYTCDDAHSTRDNRYKGKKDGAKMKCYDVPKGTYRYIESYGATDHARWKECPKGRYCPGGSSPKLYPDKYSIAPNEGMSEPQACPTNKLSDKPRLTCLYPQSLSEWDKWFDTKPKGSKYKDGKLVCKKGKNYSRRKGKCR